MPTGTCKWFSDEKGYGFITPDESGPDVFVHHSAILMDGHRKLDEGQRVDYSLVDSDKGPQATAVTILRDA